MTVLGTRQSWPLILPPYLFSNISASRDLHGLGFISCTILNRVTSDRVSNNQRFVPSVNGYKLHYIGRIRKRSASLFKPIHYTRTAPVPRLRETFIERKLYSHDRNALKLPRRIKSGAAVISLPLGLWARASLFSDATRSRWRCAYP